MRDEAIRLRETEGFYRVHQNPGGQAALVAVSKGVTPAM
jgi:hypothetical protein